MKTDIEEPSRRHKSCALLGIAGLMLSTGIVPVLLENPPLSISHKGHKISVYLPPIHVMFSMLNTVNFYLNLLSLLLHAAALHRVQGAPIRVFIMKHLPAAAQTVSFATLVLSAPLFVHAAVSEESIGFAIGAILTGAPSATRAENFIIVALSVAIAVLLVGGYMAAHVTVTDITAVVVEAGEL